MLKTERFDILLHEEIGLGKVAVLPHGEIRVGEIGCWGSCCWGN